ncbi:35641_t:CDS:1, partial [Racocetra persica]
VDDRSNIITFSYCPWCGVKLPKGLREELFNALKKEYGEEINIGEHRFREDVSPEFKSDEW